ncbi:MAG: flagellar basal body L-ring protein FlgH [Hyphomicrobiales bacterium]|nr:flagellar basal body L-ring protein FlgH [Methylobacteriaceae bacterium]MCC2101158.1 flagellar basal body L-ring protein FlgH [Hyphomicrobiales bacterium]MCC2103117.1 flagellar basal body L-ring protein FlgH [Hyphomicrobiales bacterium]MCC2106442.1 flagellar basal body L-ring protein FlgH [Hyphomicrobiales bacterium]MCO5086078.1 flagellar basal body L-ring protein FlgH [Methylobacteriaceae bacterium]
MAHVCALVVASGCAVDPRDIGRAPRLTAVGSGMTANADLQQIADTRATYSGPQRTLWDDRGGDLFRDARAAKIGDLITVVIAINDSAILGNSSDRSSESQFKSGLDGAISFPILTGKANGSVSAGTTSTSKGQGNIGRSEKIQVSVAAIVTELLPNGNLLISGSQEIRVNYELRELKVSGIVRPRDVSRDNTITYDKVAEARISYGGRGRLSEVQQPSVLHQIVDIVRPY